MKGITIDNFRTEFKKIVYQHSEISSSNNRLRQLHAWDKNGSHDKAILKELEVRKSLQDKRNEMLRGSTYDEWKIVSKKLSALTTKLKPLLKKKAEIEQQINNLFL